MKKDIEWLVKMINEEREILRQRFESGKGTPNETTFNEGRDWALAHVLRMINQLDKPEVLSQEWLDENKSSWTELKIDGYYIPVEKLQNLLVPKQEELESKIKVLIEAYKQEDGAYSNPENGWISGFVEDLENLLVPKQELPVIPKYVADWITQYRKVFDLYPALKRLEESPLGWERIYKWYRINTHKFVNAYLTGEYEVEEEPLYYALIKGYEFPSGRLSLHDGCLTKMSKEDWNEFGVNESNADFIRADS